MEVSDGEAPLAEAKPCRGKVGKRSGGEVCGDFGVLPSGMGKRQGNAVAFGGK